MRKLKLEELGRMSLKEFKDKDKFPIVIILDNIRSFHNTGSIFRSADAFRIQKMYLTGFTPCPPHREIHKTAIGAEDSVEWEYAKELNPLLQQLKDEGFTIYAVEQTSESFPLPDLKWSPTEKIALIFGNEVEGVMESALPFCKAAIEIPQYGTKHSLNVSVAVGIVLYGLVGMKNDSFGTTQ